MSGTLTRAERNLNPGNIRPLSRGEKWIGQIGVDTHPGGPFCVFQTASMGFRALAILLRNYQVKHDLNTVRKIINRWAPTNENHTANYIKEVCRHTGFTQDQVIDVRSPAVMMALCIAIAHHESGRFNFWKADELAAGIIHAGIGTREQMEALL